jgi:acyl-coenzyme A synthetase/AMP-(fatty) acid ligase
MIKTTVTFSPKEIENLIDEIDGVESSQVVGADKNGIDVVFAFVIKSDKNVDEEKIKNYVNVRVDDEKKLGRVCFVDEYPLTAVSRKVKRLELKARAEELLKN